MNCNHPMAINLDENLPQIPIKSQDAGEAPSRHPFWA